MDRVLARTRCAPASAFLILIEATPWGVLHGVRMWTRATSFVQQPATPFLQVWGLFPSTGRAELPVEQPQYRVQRKRSNRMAAEQLRTKANAATLLSDTATACGLHTHTHTHTHTYAHARTHTHTHEGEAER